MSKLLAWQNIAIAVLAVLVFWLIAKDALRPVAVDYGPAIKQMQEKQMEVDAAINNFNDLQRDYLQIKNRLDNEFTKVDSASRNDLRDIFTNARPAR